jgi:predicted alpha-1,2-mannosidase
MMGFSMSTMPGLMVMPLVGDWTVPPDRKIYASAYDKSTEKASPGYYSVLFPEHDVKTELTVARWTGVARFTFPASERATILLDLGAGAGSVEVVGDHEVRGRSSRFFRRGGNGGGRTNCFVAEFSKPFHFGVFRQNEPSVNGGVVRRGDTVNPDEREIRGSYAGAYLTFATTDGEQVVVKISTGESYEQAQKRLAAECPDWDFDAVKRAAEEAWKPKIDSVEVEGGTEKEKMIFYSCLYHSFVSPRLVTKAGETYRERGEEKTAEHDRYAEMPFWDTGRNQTVLLTLLEPKVKEDILRSEIERAQQSGYMATSFHGDHAILTFLGDWERGLNCDWAEAYKYMRKNATDPEGPRHNLAEYMKQGWVHDIVVDHPSPPYADGNAGVAKTMEYSWDDYCLARFAQKLGHDDDYRMFLDRARDYTNVFDSSSGFVRGRNEDGTWIEPFHPEEPYYNFMYKEASAWQTTWLVPHDVAGLISLMGGREKFVARLDEFFSKPYHPTGIARDVTGMLGQYCAGNQPDIQTPYFYDYAGEPWKTQQTVRKLARLMFGSDKAGLAFPGMDDQGSMASWEVMSELGFYPVNPGSAIYVIGSPAFAKASIHMGNGKTFDILARDNSEANVYIQSATLNGRPLDRPWFTHQEIANGATLEFQMGPAPNKSWGSGPNAAPPSMSDER